MLEHRQAKRRWQEELKSEYPLSYGQGIKIHMTYVLEISQDSLFWWLVTD